MKDGSAEVFCLRECSIDCGRGPHTGTAVLQQSDRCLGAEPNKDKRMHSGGMRGECLSQTQTLRRLVGLDF